MNIENQYNELISSRNNEMSNPEINNMLYPPNDNSISYLNNNNLSSNMINIGNNTDIEGMGGNYSSIFPTDNIIKNFSKTYINCDNQTINSIKSTFTSLLSENINIESLCTDNEEMKNIRSKIDKVVNDVEELFREFENIQDETKDVEYTYNKSLNELNKDIDKINEFQKFISSKNFENDGELIDPIVKNMEAICNTMLNSNEHGKIREEYNLKLLKLKLYMHSFIKTINKGNVGTLCNICMTTNVDSYVNPCGHTGCTNCLGRLEDYEMKCFVCRNKVYDIRKLYF